MDRAEILSFVGQKIMGGASSSKLAHDVQEGKEARLGAFSLGSSGIRSHLIL